MCNVDLFPGWFSLYIYILMSKEQLLVYSYYSCRAHNIIHYSCKCVQQVHMIPYNFVHIEYKLYNIQLLCKFAITLRATFSYLDNNFHLPFIKSIESCFSIIKITKQFFFLQKMIFFFFQLTKHVFDFKKTRKLFFLSIFKNKFWKVKNKNCYQT